MRKAVSVLLVILLILSFISLPCISEDDKKEWTFMFYMGGDGQPDYISDQVIKDIKELKETESNSDINLIVLKDEKGPNNTEVFEIKNNRAVEIQLKSIYHTWSDELNLGKSETLRYFIEWSKEKYPADKYFLDLWGHGEGWKGMPLEDTDYLTLPEIEKSLIDNHLDIVGFDACSMGTIEVYYQLKDVTSYIIASEVDEPISGWPYKKIFSDLKKEDSFDCEKFIKIILNDYFEKYKDQNEIPISLTGIYTENLPYEEIKNLSSILIDISDYYHELLNRSFLNSSIYDDFTKYLDFYEYLISVKQNINSQRVNISIKNTLQKMNESIMRHEHTSNKINGFGIHFPSSKESVFRYNKLKFSDNLWGELVRKISDLKNVSRERLNFSIKNIDGKMDVSISNEFDEDCNLNIYVYNSKKLQHEYNLKEPCDKMIELNPGYYWIEAFLLRDKKIVNHTLEGITITTYLNISGHINSKNDSSISIYNTRTGRWKNFTSINEDYSIALNQPKFCLPGDYLIITYENDVLSESYSIKVSQENFEKDVDLTTSNFFCYFLILLITGLSVIIAFTYLRD